MGSHLVELLVEEGFRVRVFDQPGRASARFRHIMEKLESFEGDFFRGDELVSALRGCEYVFHLIGTTVPATSNRDPVFDVESNVVGTLRLLEACRQAGVRKVIFSSSGGTVYGEAGDQPIPETHPTEPRSSYGITKLAIEKYLALFNHLHGLNYTILRMGNVYGPRLPVSGEQGVVGAFLARLKLDQPLVIYGDGLITRDYVYVKDVARAFRAAMGQSSPLQVFNIGTGVGTSLNELVVVMEKVTERRAQVVRQPARSVDVAVNILNPTRARQHLGWQPATSLETGLRHAWKWILGEREIQSDPNSNGH